MLLKILIGVLVVLVIIKIVSLKLAKYEDNGYKKTPINIYAKLNDDEYFGLSYIIKVISIMLTIVGLVILLNRYNYTKRVDIIEHQRAYVNELNRDVDMIVKTYMEHEKITFDRNVSLQALVITHPELRSVELVQSQLETLKTEKDTLNYLELKILKQRAFIKWIG